MIPPLGGRLSPHRAGPPGVGKSDKPGDLSVLHRPTCGGVTSLIGALDLRDITLVCQDWGGPTGLAQAAMMPDRFRRLVIMNTWLHHEGYEYSPGIRGWHSQWMPGGAFDRLQPEVGLLLVLSAGYGTGKEIYPHIAAGTRPALNGAASDPSWALCALRGPARCGLPRASALSPIHPLDDAQGQRAAQALHQSSLAWDKPVQFIWGARSGISESWGRSWAGA